MTQREELIKELENRIHDIYADLWNEYTETVDSWGSEIVPKDKTDALFCKSVEFIVKEILADRARIVAPLVVNEAVIKANCWGGEGANMKRKIAIEKALKLAGVDHEI